MIASPPTGLLTDEQIAELTGVKQPAAQIRVLREHGLRPVIRSDGRPRITWSALNTAMTATGTDNAAPDWSTLSRRA